MERYRGVPSNPFDILRRQARVAGSPIPGNAMRRVRRVLNSAAPVSDAVGCGGTCASDSIRVAKQSACVGT